MDSIASYIPSVVRKITETITNTKELDAITYTEFQEIDFKSSSKLVALIGYERGFQAWDLSKPSEPNLFLSKRNLGVSQITYIPKNPEGLLAITSLYHSIEFPRSTIQLFSIFQKEFIFLINASSEITKISCNSLVICAALSTCEIEVFDSKSYEKLYMISPIVNSEENSIIMSLSNLYIAYTLKSKNAPYEEVETNLTEKISKTVMSIAENGFTKIKAYMENAGVLPDSRSQHGKIWIKYLPDSSDLCEIQAFPTSASMLKFSESSHLLIASQIFGQNFHIYRINPTKKNQISVSEPRYSLIYKLYRGITPADINDISISKNEKWIVISSSKGTSHIFYVNPEETSMNFNHPAQMRIYHGSVLEKPIFPRCHIQLVDKMRPRIRVSLQESAVEPVPPELFTICQTGQFTRHVMDNDQHLVSSLSITRPISFKEIEMEFNGEQKKGREIPISIENNTSKEPNGWVPLKRSPQFKFLKIKGVYEDSLKKDSEFEECEEEKSMPAFTVHYSNYVASPNRLEQAMNSCIYNSKSKTPQVSGKIISNHLRMGINSNEKFYA